jgi:uncharacterized protein YcfJ
MDKIKTQTRIHPLVAGAAVAVIGFCGVGIAAISGVLPTSQAVSAPPTVAAAAAPAPVVEAPLPAPVAAPVAHKKTSTHHAPVMQTAQAQAHTAPAPAPAAETKPNYLAIGAGAVVGGLVGNQVGGGRGKTLATVAGAVGGGLLANEVSKSSNK